MKAVVLALFCLLSISLGAQILEPVKWNMTSRHLQGDEYELVFTASMDDHWSIYSQHTSDEGPVPTSFNFEAGDHYSRIGEVAESGGKKKEGMDPLFGVNVIKFVKGPVLFTQKVKVTDISKPITGYLEFMTCDDERCLPPTEVDFSFSVTPATDNTSGAVEPSKAEPEVQKTIEKESAPTTAVASNSKSEDDRGQNVFGEKKTIDSGNDLQFSMDDQTDKMVDPVQWQVAIEKSSDEEYEVVFTASMQEGWCIYSQYLDLKEDEIGPLPTTISFDESETYSLIGKTAEEGKKKEGLDPTFGVVVAKFVDHPVTFRQKIKVTDPSQLITGYVEYMTCDD
ncbi:MAG: hypothetical protein KDD15_34185, partial [Lewinella sp.]|nr:hypothetical protein [Lewinella sp.]